MEDTDGRREMHPSSPILHLPVMLAASVIQVAALWATFTVPLLVWVLGRYFHVPRLDQPVSRILAAILILTELITLVDKAATDFSIGNLLPLQLCDWSLFAAIIALWFRNQIAFELAYYWGIAATMQALFTPEIPPGTDPWRQAGFFIVHGGIVIGVLHLLLTGRMYPRWRNLGRVIIWAEIYLVSALLGNALTGRNFGFLSEKPSVRSMLDLYSDERWIYVLQLNATAILFFAVLCLPWAWKGRHRRVSNSSVGL